MRPEMRHVTIAVRDLGRSTAAYRDLLGRRDGTGIEAIGVSAPQFEVVQ